MCTGNCNQGRMCDCVPNVESEEDDDLEPLTPREALTMAVAMLIAAGVTFVGVACVASYFWQWVAG